MNVSQRLIKVTDVAFVRHNLSALRQSSKQMLERIRGDWNALLVTDQMQMPAEEVRALAGTVAVVRLHPLADRDGQGINDKHLTLCQQLVECEHGSDDSSVTR